MIRHWPLSTRCVTSADDRHRRLENPQDGEKSDVKYYWCRSEEAQWPEGGRSLMKQLRVIIVRAAISALPLRDYGV